MSMRKLVVIVALALVLAPACRKEKKFTTLPNTAPELIVLSGAANVNGSGDSLSYDVDAPYPAEEQIGLIAGHLQDGAYRALQRSDYARGWGDFVERAQHIYQWVGEWRNGNGDLVTYTLRYRYPAAEGPELSHLYVTAKRQPGGGKGLQTPELDLNAKPNVNHR